MARIDLDHIRHAYGDAPKSEADYALKEVSHTFEDGGAYALLGPSGCGKTTTLRMIAGFIEPTAGRIAIGGRDVTWDPPYRRDTGMVFQSYALFPHMTVGQNVAFGLEMRKVSRAEAEARVKQALELVRLGHLAERLPRQLSGGQQQRVALARALVVNPGVFLLDEPLSNLDAKLRLEVRVEIRELQKRLGLTTVFVTHDQEEALTLADRLVVMDHGIVQQVGTPEELYESPANLFVAGFIGSPPMNFAEVDVTSEAGAPVLRLAGRTIAAPAQFDLAGAPRRLVLGIRPQDVRVASPDDPQAIPGTVWMTELIGSERLIEVEIAPKLRITAEVKSEVRAELNAPAAVAFEPAKLHLFEPDTGRALPRRG